MALSGSFSSSKYFYDDTTSPTHIEVTWSATQSIPNNTSTISWKCYARNANGNGDPNGWYYVMAGPVVVTINGTTVLNKSARFAMYSNALLGSGKITVNHNTDGSKSVAVGITAAIYTYATSSSYSGTIALDKIPRYLSINSIEFANKTETSIVVKWSVSHQRTSTYYSLDNGTTWIGSATDGETLASDGKSGTFNILNLKPNTAYSVKVKFKRTDSDLWTESGAQSFTTYNYPYCNSTPNFIIGNAVKIGFYNPLGRNLKWEVLGADGSLIAANATTATSYTGISGDGSVANLYKSIPNAKSGTYKVKVTYGSSNPTITGGTYSIKGTEIPTINSFDYIDNTASTVAITGNNKHIVQNKSTLLARFTAATPNKSAGSIKTYVVKCNGKTGTWNAAGSYDLGTINSGSNVNLTLTVTDSRGLTASKTITVTMLAHSNPSAAVTLKRLNNYEDESYLTVNGAVSSVNGKNTMAIKYRYKVSGGSYGSFVTIGDNAKQTLSLDKNKIYVFNVVVTDAFGATYNKEHTLGKGVFPLFIDTAKNSVGINCFPHSESSFEIDGLGSFNSIKCKNLLYTPYTETNKLKLVATRDDHSIVTGYYCHLEKDKKYTFRCETDGAWGGTSATDTVETYLLKDKQYTTYVKIDGNPKTFTAPATGFYFLRYDVNKSGTTHSFWNFQIEEGISATGYVEAKQFEYQERYFLEEHKVGYWFTSEPLYRRIISLGASHFGTAESTTGKNIDIAHNISNIKEIIKTEDMWFTSDQYRRFPSNFYSNAGWDGQYYCTKTHICFELGPAIYNRLIYYTTSLYITIYYTKTTG